LPLVKISPSKVQCSHIATSLNILGKISAKDSLDYYELKMHKPWFDEGCSKLIDQRKQAKLQWLHNPSEINRDNLSNVTCEASRHFRNKRRQYVKNKIKELATNSKNKNMLYRPV
jgi:hypothetical protein